jgi:hypothetical protein
MILFLLYYYNYIFNMELSIDISLCSRHDNDNDNDNDNEEKVQNLYLVDKNTYSLTKSSFIYNIDSALQVIMFIDDSCIYNFAHEFRQKIKKFLDNLDYNFVPTLLENKILLIDLWGFLINIPLHYFEKYIEDKFLLNDWLEQFKNLIKQIGDSFEKRKILLKHRNVINEKLFEENLYFTLSDIQVNTNIAKYKYFIGDLKNELTDNIQFEVRTSNFEYSNALDKKEYLKKVNMLLQDIRTDDFNLVIYSNNYPSYAFIDFYEWWCNFENVRNKIDEMYVNSLGESIV